MIDPKDYDDSDFEDGVDEYQAYEKPEIEEDDYDY